MIGRMLGAAAAGAVAMLPGQALACRLALLFALDVSASVDAGEYRQQLDGLAAALTDPAVEAAIVSAPGGVALAAFEWSGKRQQTVIAGWTRIATADDLTAFAAGLSGHTGRSFSEFPTAIGPALGYGAIFLRSAPLCDRQVIDISGDGLGNDGFPPRSAYRAFDFSRITVNGLVVGEGELELTAYYLSEVIHGPGAFIEVAADFSDYARAMRRKLLRELEDNVFVEWAR